MDLHRKPPSTMGHESLIQRRPSLSHPGGLKYFFSDIQSVTLNYHTPRHISTMYIIEEELVKTMLDVCDGDGNDDDGGRKRETVVLVSYPSGCSR